MSDIQDGGPDMAPIPPMLGPRPGEAVALLGEVVQ
jgi:hypothetical protein